VSTKEHGGGRNTGCEAAVALPHLLFDLEASYQLDLLQKVTGHLCSLLSAVRLSSVVPQKGIFCVLISGTFSPE